MEILFPMIIGTCIENFSTCFRASNFKYSQGFILAFKMLGVQKWPVHISYRTACQVNRRKDITPYKNT